MDLQTQVPEPQKEPRKVPLPELPPPNKISVANQVCWYMGGLLLAAGLIGFVTPGLFAAHLNPVHNLIFLVSGVISLWFGLTSPDYTAKRFSKWFGGIYMLFGLAGFAFGQRGLSLTRPTTTGLPEESFFLWKLVPGHFELGTTDHVFHILVGAVFLAGSYFTLRKYKPAHKIIWH